MSHLGNDLGRARGLWNTVRNCMWRPPSGRPETANNARPLAPVVSARVRSTSESAHSAVPAWAQYSEITAGTSTLDLGERGRRITCEESKEQPIPNRGTRNHYGATLLVAEILRWVKTPHLTQCHT